jgi:tripartite-type tricarboxylate transporter receptor subunit TctC
LTTIFLIDMSGIDFHGTKVNLLRTKRVCFFLIVLIFFSVESSYCAEDPAKFPTRPITFICPLPPGSTGDVSDRLISNTAEKFLGQPVVVVNKPGGGTTIGTAAIAAAKPDGYTVGYTAPGAMLIYPFVEQLPYHPLKDFQQIIQYSEATFAVTVRADSPFKTFKDIVAFARENPKKLTYAMNGPYSVAHITMLQIAKKEGIQFNHMPVKGGPEIMAALLGGHIKFGAGDFNYSLLEAGQIPLLALLGENRRPEYPGIPTLRDLGYDRPEITSLSVFQNIAGPKGIPEEIVKKLEQAFTQAIKEPSFIKGLKDLRFPVVYRNSKEMAEHIADYYQFYGKILKEMGLAK